MLALCSRSFIPSCCRSGRREHRDRCLARFEFEKRGETVPGRGVDDKMEKGMQLTLFTSDKRHGGQLLRLSDVDAALPRLLMGGG